MRVTNQEFQNINHISSYLIKGMSDSLLAGSNSSSVVSNYRRSLGVSGLEISDKYLESAAAEFEYLASEWLDIFEKGVFEGKTLSSFLREGG
jgi:hypothetical protein